MNLTDKKTIYKSNKKSILRIMGLLLLLLIALDLIAIKQQVESFSESTQIRLQEELELVAYFALDPLLKDDYVKIEEFLGNWAAANESILSLNAIAPNGFDLIRYQSETQSNHFITASHDIAYQGRHLLTLHIKEDVTETFNSTIKNALNLVGISIVLILAFTYFLWITLRRTAIRPLELEIKERKIIEAELQEKSKDLSFSNKELESYSYSIAHDLRTPLRSIVSFSQILENDAFNRLTNEEHDYLQRIIKSGTYMSSLIDDILNLSHISRVSINKKAVNLTDIVNNQLNLLKEAGELQKGKITVEENINAVGDSRLLPMLIGHLLSNAAKYSSLKDNPEIEFGTITTEKRITYFIKDNGIGFNMGYSAKLFKPFERLHSNEDIPGTGIGLAICKRIIDRHHGKIWIESEENQGTTVFFTLP